MSFDLQKLVRSHIADLRPYSSARDEFDPVEREVVYLDANENPFDNGVNRYPDPQLRIGVTIYTIVKWILIRI